jgi:hypothetical protein
MTDSWVILILCTVNCYACFYKHLNGLLVYMMNFYALFCSLYLVYSVLCSVGYIKRL